MLRLLSRGLGWAVAALAAAAAAVGALDRWLASLDSRLPAFSSPATEAAYIRDGWGAGRGVEVRCKQQRRHRFPGWSRHHRCPNCWTRQVHSVIAPNPHRTVFLTNMDSQIGCILGLPSAAWAARLAGLAWRQQEEATLRRLVRAAGPAAVQAALHALPLLFIRLWGRETYIVCVGLEEGAHKW